MKYLCHSITVRFEAFFLLAKCNTDNFIFSHHKFRISYSLFNVFEVIGTHVFIGENIEIIIAGEIALNSFDDVAFMIACFGFDSGE